MAPNDGWLRGVRPKGGARRKSRTALRPRRAVGGRGVLVVRRVDGAKLCRKTAADEFEALARRLIPQAVRVHALAWRLHRVHDHNLHGKPRRDK